MAFSSGAHGDPVTPILQAHVGDAMRVHVLGAPGSEQPHVLGMGGLRWPTDPRLPGATTVEATAVSPWTSTDLEIIGGAGGQGGLIGDMWYGDLRRPFTEAGMWGLLRVLPAESCAVKRLDGTACGPRPAPSPSPEPPVDPEPVAETPVDEESAPAPVSPQPASPQPAPQRLRDLVAPRTQSLRGLRRHGLQFRVTVPDAARALAVQLRRSGGKVVTTVTVRLAAGGPQRIQWKLDARTLGRLRSGRYTLRVRAGKDARTIGPDRLEQKLELRAGSR
jgi:hypothetical protein